jgi:hypothetical protein
VTEAAVSSVDSYEIVLPPGWKQYPVQRGIAEKLYRHVRRVLEPTGNQQIIDQMRSVIYKAMRDLREHGGIDLFIPEDSRTGAAIPAALVSNRVSLGAKGLDVSLRLLTRGREYSEVDTVGGIAYRWETPTVGADSLTGLESGNIHYLFPFPGDTPTTGVMFTFSVLKSDELADEYREILVLIFDAMMNSLIWIYSEDS